MRAETHDARVIRVLDDHVRLSVRDALDDAPHFAFVHGPPDVPPDLVVVQDDLRARAPERSTGRGVSFPSGSRSLLLSLGSRCARLNNLAYERTASEAGREGPRPGFLLIARLEIRGVTASPLRSSDPAPAVLAHPQNRSATVFMRRSESCPARVRSFRREQNVPPHSQGRAARVLDQRGTGLTGESSKYMILAGKLSNSVCDKSGFCPSGDA